MSKPEKNPAAVALGKLGRGKRKRMSAEALAANRRNGALGGRPRRKPDTVSTATPGSPA